MKIYVVKDVNAPGKLFDLVVGNVYDKGLFNLLWLVNKK